MANASPSKRTRRLVAVILVTRSRPGPRIVFHYPPCPEAPSETANDGSGGWESDGDSDADAQGKAATNEPQLDYANGDDSHPLANAKTETGPEKQSLDTILGFSEDSLQKLLSPGCSFDRKKFEISLDSLTFVSHPIYAAQDGSWAKKHTHEGEAAKTGPRSTTPAPATGNASTSDEPDSRVGITITEPKSPMKEPQDFKHVPESFDSQAGGISLATSMNSSNTSTPIAPEQLTMFNVVFVLASSNSESAHQEVSDTYQHVAKTLSKALHYCQKQTQYLGIESKKLLAVKAKAKQDGITRPSVVGEQMLESSELAWALKEVYEKVSAGEIAGIRLNGTEMSLQIPLSMSSGSFEHVELSRDAGLLLLEDKEILLRDLAHPDASPLVHFIRGHTPTKSLQKHAVNLSMRIDDILYIARHLIKWRKARAITPLHPRNTYVLGRYAPLGEMQAYYIQDYAKRFPVMPSLTQILKVLSGKPIKYSMLIPSRDHRTPYMEILAYLVQHGFVEQMKTFGWLRAPTTAVRKQLQVEEVNENRRPLSVASLLSPQMRPVHDDDTASTSSERTAIPVSEHKSAKRRSGNTSQASHPEDAATENEEQGKIIANPQNLSEADSQRVRHIRDSLHDEELADRLPSLLRHFDGESAFEDVAAMEGLKRAKVETWLDLLQREGFLLTFRAV